MRLPIVTPRTYRRVTMATLFAVGIIVVTGAAVRLTGSGLGCSDWPACSDTRFVGAANFNQQVEQANRLFTGVVSVAIVAAVLGSLARRPRRRDLIAWSSGLVVGVITQSVLGGVTVLTHLSAPIVMAHFLLSAVLVWNAVVLFDRAGHEPTPPVLAAPERARTLGRAMVALAAAVLVTGTAVTGAGPHGGDARVKRLPFAVQEVARIHSAGAWALLTVILWLGWTLHRNGTSERARRRFRALTMVVVAQGALGYTQYFLGIPPGLVAVHVAGSVTVWAVALTTYLALFSHPAAPRSDAGDVGDDDVEPAEGSVPRHSAVTRT